MNAEKTSGKVTPPPVKTTRGEIEGFDRGIYNYMKKQLSLTDQQIFKMKGARSPAKINGQPAAIIRYFDSDNATEKGLTINDYESLNEHPELILFEGYRTFGKDAEINIRKREGNGGSFLAEKISQGDITEVGIVIEKPASQKWLSRIGNFMMMGGFLVVLLVVVGLVIGISIAFNSC